MEQRNTGKRMSSPGMYQVLGESQSYGFQDRRSMIKGWMGPDVGILMDPLCDHTPGFIQ